MLANRTVFAEVPDFGFGPAASFADLAAGLGNLVRWTVATAGNAQRFLREAMPTANFVEFNGFQSESWPLMPTFSPPGSLWLTMSNPRFADWAGSQGYPVVLVDQLYWMWGAAELGGRRYAHVAPRYFREVAATAEDLRYTRPIVELGIARHLRNFEDRTGTVIAFGGMAVAGDPTAADAYASWLLDLAMPIVLELTDEPVHIVGGSPTLVDLCRRWSRDPRVRAEGALGRGAYLDLLGSSRFQILTPGLSTIYEASELRLSPLFQPGANKSMVLQLDDLSTVTPQHCARWSWAAEKVPHLRSIPQIQALMEIAELFRTSLLPASPEAPLFVKTLRKYINAGGRGPLDLGLAEDLHYAHDVVSQLFDEHYSRKA